MKSGLNCIYRRHALTAAIGAALLLNGQIASAQFTANVTNTTVTGQTVTNGGTQTVGTAGTTVNTIINAGGTQIVNQGGATTGTRINGGTQNVRAGGTATGTTVIAGGTQFVRAGATVTNTTVNNGSIQYVDSGATTTGTTLNGGIQTLAGGTDTGAIVNNNGTQTVNTGGTATWATINNGGTQNVNGGGTATNAAINNGGRQIVNSGGTATGSAINNGGTQNVDFGGTAASAVIAINGTQNVNGGATNTTINGGTQNVNVRGSATDTTIANNGIQNVMGTATRSTINDGGVQTVYTGGTATNAAINNGGLQEVNDGGNATGAEINNGGIQNVNLGGTATSSTIAANGIQTVASGGTAESTTINGGTQNVNNGGNATGSTIANGGVQNVNGTGTGTTVNAGGTQNVNTGGTATNTTLNGGAQDVRNGGIATGTTINKGGIQYVQTASNDGAVTDTTVNDGGTQLVYASATAKGTTVNDGGKLTVVAGGTLDGHTRILGTGQLQSSSGDATSVTNLGTLEFAPSGASTYADTFRGSGGVLKSGAETLAFTGTVAQSQGFTVTGGTLDLNGGNYAADGAALVTLTGTDAASTRVVMRNNAQLSGGNGLVVADGATVSTAQFNSVTIDAGANPLVLAKNASDLSVDMIDSILAGNITYQDSSKGRVTMTRSQFSGAIDPADATIDNASRWTMTGDSQVNTLALAGTVDFQAPVGAFTPKSLTVQSLNGQGGTIVLNHYLHDGQQDGDRVIVDGGAVTGQTQLSIRNVGGLGAATQGNGYLLVEGINGADTTAQSSKNGFVLSGPLYAGAYEYRLYAGDASGAGENWYLATQRTLPANPITPPADPANPSNPSNPSTPSNPTQPIKPPTVAQTLYRPAAASLPAAMDLSGRMALQPLLNYGQGPDEKVWATVTRENLHGAGDGVANPNYKASITALNLGAELWNGGQTRVGVYGSVLWGNGDAAGDVRGKDGTSAGQIKQTAYVLGAFARHQFASGVYLKGALQGSKATGSVDNIDATKVRNTGLAASVEAGLPLRLNPAWTLEPQAQVIYQKQRFDDARLSNGTVVDLSSGHDVTSRVGLRLGWQPQAAPMRAYVTANVLHRSSATQDVRFQTLGTSTPLGANFGGTFAQIGVGVEAPELTKNVSVIGGVGYLRSLSGPSQHSVVGQLGVKVKF